MPLPNPAAPPWALVLPLSMLLAAPAPGQCPLRPAAGGGRALRPVVRPWAGSFRSWAGPGRVRPLPPRSWAGSGPALAGRGISGAPGAPAGLGGEPLVRLELKASAPSVRSCGSCTLSADLRRGRAAFWHWTVEEPDGGTLALDGEGQVHYTAPFVTGRRTFHVRASSSLDPSFYGRVAIEVQPNALLAVLEPTPAGAEEPGLAIVAGGLQVAEDPDDVWHLAARIARPHGVAHLPSGGRWLVSYPGNRAFLAAGGEVGPQQPGEVSGHRTPGRSLLLSGPTDLAGNGLEGHRWRCAFSETDRDRIRLVDARGVVRPLAGEGGGPRDSGADPHQDGPADAARFRAPEGVALDPDGTVYVADVGNGALRRIRDGLVTTLLAPGPGRPRHAWGDRRDGWKAGFPAPLSGGLALDPGAGVLYATAGNAVLAVALGGGREGQVWTVAGDPDRAGFEEWLRDPPATLAGVPCLNGPRHLACFRGRLYLSDRGNHAIREYRPDTGGLRTLAGDPGQPQTRPGPLRVACPHLPPEACAALAQPMGLAFAPDGECRVATRDGVVALRGLDDERRP